jgi:peptidoglycan/LPS O-acetylase OafA/YrhL
MAGPVARANLVQRKLDALTGLRAVAAGMIVFLHTEILRIPIPPYALDSAVGLFFVWSGFILTYVHPRLEDWAATRDFLALRIARIWPAHLVTLFAAGVIHGYLLALPSGGLKLLANVVMVQSWIPIISWIFSYNSLSWSISTEFFFYLAFPLLIWRWCRTWLWTWLGAVALLAGLVLLCGLARLPVNSSTAVSLTGLLYANPLARLFDFVTGMAACSCFLWLRPRLGRMKGAAATAIEFTILGVSACCIVYYLALRGAVGFLAAHAVVMIVFSILIIALGAGLGLASRLLSSAAAVLLGEISYAVYLVHQLVYFVYAQHWLPGGTAPDYGGWIICLLVTLVVSLLIWRFIETPVRRMVRNRLTRNGFVPQRQAETADSPRLTSVTRTAD